MDITMKDDNGVEHTFDVPDDAKISNSAQTAGYLPGMQKALIRMRIAYEKGKGCRLTWEELEEFNRSLIGDWWNVPVNFDMGK